MLDLVDNFNQTDKLFCSKIITKAGDKRKRSEEPSVTGVSKLSKKAKLSEEEDNPGTPEQVIFKLFH